jgi:hypothetical protein
MFLPLLAIGAASFSSTNQRILFLGNSHTANYDVPSMVKNLLLSDSIPGTIETRFISGGFLEDIYRNAQTLNTIRNDKWSHVVLQAHKLSSSHQYTYSTVESIALAREAKKAGSQALFFAEWPRKGIDESNYIYRVYAGLADASDASVMPICYVWDAARSADQKTVLWANDGNHSSQAGAFLAAIVIYSHIAGHTGQPTWLPTGLSRTQANLYLRLARTRGRPQP